MRTKLCLLFCFLLSLGQCLANEFFSEAVTNTKVQVSAVPCTIVGYKIINRDTTNPIFVHLYNALSANVTVGTSVQATAPIAVPANGAILVTVNNDNENREVFSTALTIAITTSPLHTDNTAPSTAAVVSIRYKQ